MVILRKIYRHAYSAMIDDSKDILSNQNDGSIEQVDYWRQTHIQDSFILADCNDKSTYGDMR